MALYERRFYRDRLRGAGLHAFIVREGESDIFVLAQRDISSLVRDQLRREREALLRYLTVDPFFQNTLIPRGVFPEAPPVVRLMSRMSFLAGVGPMAAVAGAMNDRIGSLFGTTFGELILENGGDLLVYSKRERVVGVYTGKRSPFRDKLGIVLPPGRYWGVATSSGVVGPSFSFGQADSVTVLAASSALADAWATRLANEVKTDGDIQRILEFSARFPEMEGVVVCYHDRLGVWGAVQLTEVDYSGWDNPANFFPMNSL
ncbi:MAG TPA: UPF0280 family protein [Atribacteraceae bacterium]|nr:UPF0280 family protein [Atribacteraceae bacterium]